MDITDQIIKNKKYRDQIDQISSEKLKIIAEDHMRALEEANNGIKQFEPKKINDIKYLQDLADGMQKLAQKVLKKRAKK